MKKFVSVLVVLFFATCLGLLLKHDPGYVLLSYDLWTIETTLWFAVILLALLFAAVLILLKALRSISHLGQRFDNWQRKSTLKKSQQQSKAGFIALAEGHWQKAEKLLIRGIEDKNDALLNYLGAAIAAQEQKNHQQRDDYLRLAHEDSTQAETAIGITQARLQLEHGQLEQSLATLERLHRLQPHHPHVLVLLKHLCLRLQDWQRLLDLLPALKKNKVLTSEQQTQLQCQAYLAQLQRLIEQEVSYAELITFWQSLNKKWQNDHRFLQLFIPIYQQEEASKAEILLKKAIKQQWHDDSVRLYGLCPGSNVSKQLALCESWLKEHPQNSVLLLTLGRLCLQLKLWGKAENYLQASLQSQARAESYLALGLLYQQLEQTDKACQCFADGLQCKL